MARSGRRPLLVGQLCGSAPPVYRAPLFTGRYGISVSAVSSAVELRAPGPRGIPSLFSRLVDDAALFPPGSTPVPEAVSEHLQARQGQYAGVMGPSTPGRFYVGTNFIIPVSSTWTKSFG